MTTTEAQKFPLRSPTPQSHRTASRSAAGCNTAMRSSGGGRGGGGTDAVAWTAAELEVLRQSIRENGLDDWRTLGDWSQVKK